MKRILLFLLVTLLAVMVGSCNLFGGKQGSVSLQVTGNRAAAFPTSLQTASVSTTEGGKTLIVTQVEMVMFEVVLTVPDSTDAEDFEVGPILLNLPLGAETAALGENLVIPAGQYEALDIEVKIPEGHEDQAAFQEKYPEWDITKSVRVEGTYDGTPFVFLLDFNDDIRLDLDPPVTITDKGTTGVVLAIDVSTWLLNAAGTELFDPAVVSANLAGPEAAQIEANIENSFEAFEDSQS